MNVFYGTGDAGDLTAALPIIRHLGGGELILGPHEGEGWPREPMTQARAEFLLPLIAAQPYITSARYQTDKNGVTHDFSHFRVTHKYQHGESLIGWQARHFRLDVNAIDLSPWLTATPSPFMFGKVVFARSARYQCPEFPWRRIYRKYGHQAVFIGLRSEYMEFLRHVGRVPYRPVANALQMAEMIAGSQLFVGNQSFPCWVAMGLGHRLIQETYPQIPNSIIPRHNAVFESKMFKI